MDASKCVWVQVKLFWVQMNPLHDATGEDNQMADLRDSYRNFMIKIAKSTR